MSIIKTLSKYDFIEEFKRIKPDNFTETGLAALYDYLEQLSDDTGKNIEFYPIALCFEYAEYEDMEELKNDYPDITFREDLNTTVISVPNGGFIIERF